MAEIIENPGSMNDFCERIDPSGDLTDDECLALYNHALMRSRASNPQISSERLGDRELVMRTELELDQKTDLVEAA